MKQAKQLHPSPEELGAFGQGRLSPPVRAQIERHVMQCDFCCEALRRLPDDTLAEKVRKCNVASDTHEQPDTATRPASTLSDGAPPPELVKHSRYRILKSLGVGGMGEVYQAEHRRMERVVALKVINRDLTKNRLAVERFHKEVKAAARLSHPNIVTAYDADQAGDLHFLVMEYVEGTSLARLVEQGGQRPVAHACHYARQAALGLQHAFERGMVHRDIKPQNLMVTPQGQIKILDFGLARFARESNAEPPIEASQSKAASSSLTGAGAFLGTPDYMAPEQAHDPRRADIRADIYSLGCTLYYVLAGQVPFPGGSSLEKMFAHVERTPPPVAQLRSDVPADLVRVVERMMAKDPAHRYQTPAEAAQALLPFTKMAAVPSAGNVQASPAGRLSVASQPASQLPRPVASGLSGLTQVETAQQDTRRAGSRRRGNHSLLRWAGLAAAVVLLGAGVVAVIAISSGPSPDRKLGTPGTQLAQNSKSARQSVAVTPRKATGQVLVVMPPGKIWNYEYTTVRQALEQGGLKVKVAAPTLDDVLPDPHPDNSGGLPVKPDILIRNAKAADYDAVIFDGSSVEINQFHIDEADRVGARRLFREVLQASEMKYLAGTSKAALLFTWWGALVGEKATGPDWAREEMAKWGMAEPVDLPVVVSGRVITWREWNDTEAFAQKLLECLKQSSTSANQPPSVEPAAGAIASVLFVLPTDKVFYQDYAPVRQRLEKARVKTKVAAATLKVIRPDDYSKQMGGLAVTPDILLSDAKAADYDAVIFVGGEGMIEFKTEEETPIKRDAHRLFREAVNATETKYVAALGNATAIFVAWDELRGKRATGPDWSRMVMKMYDSAKPVDEAVVVSGRVITGRDPKDAMAFTQKLIECLKSR